jgi:hypothetical protein
VHDLLHESDRTTDPEESRGNRDGRGERKQGFSETCALSIVRHDGFLRPRR